MLSIPIGFTLIFAVGVLYDNYRTGKLYERLKVNKLTFRNPNSAVRDSIIELKNLMEKLPRRQDHGAVDYSIDKYPNSYGQFNFNWQKIGGFEALTINNRFRSIELKSLTEWGTQDKTPFDTLTQAECDRFISLIEFLDFNKLNGAELNSFGDISLSYNDSLRIAEGVAFRTVVLDTTNSFSPSIYYCFDSKDGLYLVTRVKN